MRIDRRYHDEVKIAEAGNYRDIIVGAGQRLRRAAPTIFQDRRGFKTLYRKIVGIY